MPGCRIRCCRPAFPRRRNRSRRSSRSGDARASSISSAAAAARRRRTSRRSPQAVRGIAPRVVPTVEPYLRLSGIDALTLTPETNFVNIGERANVTGSPKFAKLILAGNYEEAVSDRAAAGGKRRADHRREHGRGDARRRGGDDALPQLHHDRAGDRAGAGDGRLLEVERDRGGAEVHPGQGDRELDLAQGRRGEISRAGAARAALRRGGRGHGVRRAGAGGHA